MKRLLAGILFCTLCLSGCGTTEISIASNKRNEKIIQIGEQFITYSEMNIIHLDYEKMYSDNFSAAFGREFWKRDTGDGVLLKDYVKEKVLWNELIELLGLCEIAQHEGIVLSEEQKKQAVELGELYYSHLNANLADELLITKKSSISLMEKYLLARDVIQKCKEKSNIEVSENEARVILIGQLPLDNKEEAQQIYDKIMQGEASWENITSNLEVENVQVTRGDYVEDIEKILFSLDTGEMSQPIPFLDKYYLFYCENDHLIGESEQNRYLLLDQHNYEVWSNLTEQIFEKEGILLNQNLWNDITLVYRENTQMLSFRECLLGT